MGFEGSWSSNARCPNRHLRWGHGCQRGIFRLPWHGTCLSYVAILEMKQRLLLRRRPMMVLKAVCGHLSTEPSSSGRRGVGAAECWVWRAQSTLASVLTSSSFRWESVGTKRCQHKADTDRGDQHRSFIVIAEATKRNHRRSEFIISRTRPAFGLERSELKNVANSDDDQ